MNQRPLVSFWGTRGSIAVPGRHTEKYGGNTPCISMRYGDQYFICDAGTGINPLGQEIISHFKSHSQTTPTALTMMLTHTHWDHIQGLPFFVPAYHPAFELSIYGQQRSDVALESALSGQMDASYFPVPMSSLRSRLKIHELKEQPLVFGDVKVYYQELPHPGSSIAFSFHVNGKKLVYATDCELDGIFHADGTPMSDCAMANEYAEFIRDADLLVGDGQYTSEEYATKKTWGHTSIPVLLKIAHRHGVKRCSVFHHDPMHSDAIIDDISAPFIEEYKNKERPMEVFWTREGMTLPL